VVYRSSETSTNQSDVIIRSESSELMLCAIDISTLNKTYLIWFRSQVHISRELVTLCWCHIVVSMFSVGISVATYELFQSADCQTNSFFKTDYRLYSFVSHTIPYPQPIIMRYPVRFYFYFGNSNLPLKLTFIYKLLFFFNSWS
jgi:hypothetical protein